MPSALISSSRFGGWSRIAAARWMTVSAPAHRVAQAARVAEVGERELDADAVRSRAAWDRGPGSGPPRPSASSCAKQRRAHHPGCAGEQDHGAQPYPSAPAARQSPGASGLYNSASRGPAAGPKIASDTKETHTLAYVIAEPCIGEKDNSCVEVCPVDCIHPTPDEPDYEAAEAALHRSRRVHRLRRLRRGLPRRRLLRRGSAPRGVGQVHGDQRGVLRRASRRAGGRSGVRGPGECARSSWISRAPAAATLDRTRGPDPEPGRVRC